MHGIRPNRAHCPYNRPFEHATTCTCRDCAARSTSAIAWGLLFAAITAAAIWCLV